MQNLKILRIGVAALIVAAFVALASVVHGATPESARGQVTVYTFRTPGVCGACDIARPIVERLAKLYPIEFVHPEDASGDARCRADRVVAFPTFIATHSRADAPMREVFRWSGSRDLERRLLEAFRAMGIAPRRLVPASFPVE